MTDRERELESQVRKLRSEILDLRLRLHGLEGDNSELRRRITVQSIQMDKARQAAYQAYDASMEVIAQRFGLD